MRDLGGIGKRQHLAISIAGPTLPVHAAITGTHHRRGCCLVGKADARREVGVALLYVEVGAPLAVTRNADVAGIQIEQTTLPFAVDRLWKVNLPTQAIVGGEFVGDSPGVLRIEESALLPFLRICVLGLGALVGRGIAQKKRGEAKAGRGATSNGIEHAAGANRGEVEVARAHVIVVQAD